VVLNCLCSFCCYLSDKRDGRHVKQDKRDCSLLCGYARFSSKLWGIPRARNEASARVLCCWAKRALGSRHRCCVVVPNSRRQETHDCRQQGREITTGATRFISAWRDRFLSTAAKGVNEMLLPIKRILWPTDFSGPSYEALEDALEMCEHFSAELVAVHAVPEIPRIPAIAGGDTEALSYLTEIKNYEQALHKALRQKLDEVIRQRVPKETKAKVIVTRGDAACEIVRVAEDERVSLIVTATHGLSGWRQLTFGSVAGRVLRVATCPVLTIRSPRERR
jgi:nucleotide-binding universal stress UspA family protein